MAFRRKKQKNLPPYLPPLNDLYEEEHLNDLYEHLRRLPRNRYLDERYLGYPPNESQAFDPKEYQRALELGEVHSAYVRVMFVGPGGVGKSSLLCGLLNKPLRTANSTQLVDTLTVKPDTLPIDCNTAPKLSQSDMTAMSKPATKKWAKVSSSNNPLLFWREVTDQDEIMELVGFLNFVAKRSDSADTIEATADSLFRPLSLTSKQISTTSQQASEGAIELQKEVVDDILKVAKLHPYVQPPKEEVLMNIWDCGGQAVFLDILPTFLTPRTMFILMYDASRSLTDKCLIRIFRDDVEIHSQEHKATTLELLLEWMASIHAMLRSTPQIICVGTHGDKITNSQVVSSLLKSECRGKAFTHLLKTSIIINNTKAGQGENEDPGFGIIRREIQEFAYKDLQVRTPVAWVLFRRVFQKKTKESNAAIVPYKTAVDIAIACKIPPRQISTMITFYHDLAVFFHYSEVPGLKNFVIADPQWLITQFADILALQGFEKFPNDNLWVHLREKGILVEPLYEKIWKNSDSEIKPQFLMDLLVHFLLAAPIEAASKVTNVDGKEYFISCVLPASDSTTRDKKSVIHTKMVIKQATPLHLLFNTYYVPPGFFPRLVTTLVNSRKFRVSFAEGVYRDSITMFYGNAHCEIDEVTLTKCKSSVKIEVIRTKHRSPGNFPFSIVCREILDFITDSFSSILHWLRGIEISHAFICNSCPEEVNTEKQHFIRIPYAFTLHTWSNVRCDKDKYANLTVNHRYWLKYPKDNHSNTPCLSGIELQQVGHIVQSQGKIIDLAKSLEMTVDQTLLDDPHAGYEILKAWSKEMQEYASSLRVHLSHHLVTLGINDVANRLLRNRPLVHVAFIQQKASDNLLVAPNIVQDRLNLVLDSENSGVPKHLGEIAEQMYEWEGKVSEELGLTKADVNNIKELHKNQLKLQIREALQRWKQKLGGKATYQNLITAFERSFHYDYADFVRNMIIGSNISAGQSNTSTQNRMEITVQRSEMSSLQIQPETTRPIELSVQVQETNSKPQPQLEKQEAKSSSPPKVSDQFSEEMNIVQLSQWLCNHPKVGNDYQEDIDKLKDAKINGCGFLELDRDSLKELEVSVGFRLAVTKIIKDLPKEVSL